VLFKDVDVGPIGKNSKDVLDRKQLQERKAGKESKKTEKSGREHVLSFRYAYICSKRSILFLFL